MMDELARRNFINELWGRHEEMQRWAIANWPDKDHPLTAMDFVEGRKEILALGLAGRRAPPASAAEPERGGPQYEEVTPAPWP